MYQTSRCIVDIITTGINSPICLGEKMMTSKKSVIVHIFDIIIAECVAQLMIMIDTITGTAIDEIITKYKTCRVGLKIRTHGRYGLGMRAYIMMINAKYMNGFNYERRIGINS